MNGEPLFIEQFTDPAHKQYFMMLIVPPIATALDRLELNELLLPVTQNVRLYTAQLAHLADSEVSFCGDGRQGSHA